MTGKLMKVLCSCLLVFGLFIGDVAAQSAIGNQISLDQNKQLYRQSLLNMDQQNANLGIQLTVNVPVGIFKLNADVLCQKSPILVKNTVNAQFTSDKTTVPVFSMTQYMQSEGNNLLVYSTDNPNDKKAKWYLNKTALNSKNSFIFTDSEEYNKHVQFLMTLVKNIQPVAESGDVRTIKVVFDNQKLFADNIVNGIFENNTGVTVNQQKLAATDLHELFTALRATPDITGTIAIDTRAHKILSEEYDLTNQARIIGNMVYKNLSVEDKDGIASVESVVLKDKKATAPINNEAVLKNLIDNSTTKLTVQINPITDVMQLAVPQDVRDNAEVVDIKGDK